MPLPRVLRHFWMGLLVLTGAAFAVSKLTRIKLFFGPGNYFLDLRWYEPRFQHYGTAEFYSNPPRELIPWNLPDTMAILYRFFYLQRHPLAVYFAIHAIILVAAGWLLVRIMTRRGIALSTALGFTATVIVTSFPLWFLLECANLEMFVVLPIACGIIAYLCGHHSWAAACFGFAAALKLTPILYLALFVTRRDHRKLLLGLGVAASVFLIGEWWVGPTLPIALHGMQSSLAAYKARVVLASSPSGLSSDHSLFSICKHLFFILRVCFGWLSLTLGKFYPGYMISAGVASIGIYVGWIRRLPTLNKAIAVTVLSQVLPPVSWDYRLLHLYPIFGVLLLCALDSDPNEAPAIEKMFALLAVLFTCHTFLYYRVNAGYGVSVLMAYGGLVQIAALLSLLYFAIRYPLAARVAAS